MSHKCAFEYSGYSKPDREMLFIFKCVCGAVTDRKATAKEIKAFEKHQKDRGDVHWIWHQVAQDVKDDDGNFAFSGVELMERMEKWADKYPDYISIAGCDDSYFSSSDLAFVDHRSKTGNAYMGVSVLFIPQCSGHDPVEFFLYPGHMGCLIQVLQKHMDSGIKGLKQARIFNSKPYKPKY